MKRFIAAFLLLLTLVGCSYVPPGNVGIKVYLTGASKGVDHEVLPVGRYYIGINEQLYLYPTFQQNYVWTASPNEGKARDESITFQTKEGMDVKADIGVSYSLDADKIPGLFQRYRKDIEEITDVYLHNYVRDAFVSNASTMSVSEVYGEGKAALLAKVQKEVVDEVAPQGIKIEKIYLVGSMRLPKSVQDALEAKITATQLTQQRENEVAQAKAEALKVVAAAEGEAQAALTKAKSEAEANRLKEQSLTENLIRYETIRKWDGKLPQYSGGGTPLINLNAGAASGANK